MNTKEEIRSILIRRRMGDKEVASNTVQLAEEWSSWGGVSFDGVSYGAAETATEWGFRDCPVLPRALRDLYHEVQLPAELMGIFDRTITLNQLDSDVLRRSDMVQLSPVHRRHLRDVLYGMQIPMDMIVIPAGIPWSWLSSLPVSSRAKNALQRLFHGDKSSAIFESPLTSHQFMSLRGVGVSALIEWMCVIESAEAIQHIPSSQISNPLESRQQEKQTITAPIRVLEEVVRDETRRLLSDTSPLAEDIYKFARWALAEASVDTIGEAIRVANSMGSNGPEEWTSLSERNLAELAVQPIHHYAVIDAWVENLDGREIAIFKERLSTRPPRQTLQELADSFQVSRERIRQLESRLQRKFARFLTEEEANPVHWRAETVRRAIGVAIPSGWVESVLEAPPGCHDYRSILLDIAGPYRCDKGWYINSKSIHDDPTPTILDQADEVGRIDPVSSAEQLSSWGLQERFHTDWLTRDGVVRSFKGRLVRWGASVGDRMAFALDDLGRPSTIDELMRHIQEITTRNSVTNALGVDPRIIRVNQTHWALKSWGVPEYSGVAYSIKAILEKNGPVMTVDGLVWEMIDTYGIKESTTRAYCAAPLFVSDGESMQLRTAEHGPYQSDLSSIRDSPGIFHLGPGRVSLLLRVDDDMLRGSGAILTHAAGAVLGVSPNANLQFSNQFGDTVKVTFPETSIVGPSLGSVRLIAERLGAKLGDYLTIILDISDVSLDVRLTDMTQCQPGWETVGRLTGIRDLQGLQDLAPAMGCDTGEVRALLRERRDESVLESLPITPVSKSLDDALAALGMEVQRGREGGLI